MHMLIICLTMLFMGTILALSSMNWLFIWLGLEINLFGFLVLIKSKNNQKNLEGVIKYFIVQVFSSMLFLFFIFSSYWDMLMLPLLVKISSVPFHLWFIPVLKSLDWWDILLIMTWQKVAPLLLMFNLNFSKSLMTCLIIMNSILGSFLGLLQVKIKKILGYSSIYHISWMLLLIGTMKYLMAFYLFLYFLLNYCLIEVLKDMNINNIFKLLSITTKSKLLIMMGIFSLSGLPPFFGFFLKWYIMSDILISFSPILLLLLFLAIINLFFYFQFIISSFIISSTSSQKSSKSFKSPMLSFWLILFVLWY